MDESVIYISKNYLLHNQTKIEYKITTRKLIELSTGHQS